MEKRKNRAPRDVDQMPQEDRCPLCWRILSLYEVSAGVTHKWCSHCQYIKREKE